MSEENLAGKLEKVRLRLAMGAANMTKPGEELIAWYLNPDRLPVAARWSRRHALAQAHRLPEDGRMYSPISPEEADRRAAEI